MCKASGNPAPEVTWKKGGKAIRGNRQRHTIMNMPHGSVLRIDTAKQRDDGTIECVADNSIGEAVASATLEVYQEGHSELQICLFTILMNKYKFINNFSNIFTMRHTACFSYTDQNLIKISLLFSHVHDFLLLIAG